MRLNMPVLWVLSVFVVVVLACPALSGSNERKGAVEDPLFKDSGALKEIGIEEAWKITKGDPRIVVAVVDSGVDAKHEDLQGQFVRGWNAVTKKEDDTQDERGHGTRVAGIIAAKHNKLGNAGIAPGCKIMPIKVTSGTGLPFADWADVAKGIDWAVKNGAEIVCVPLGSRTGSKELKKAVEDAMKAGCLVIAPTGNHLNIHGDLFPARYEGVIAVRGGGGFSLKDDSLWLPKRCMTTTIGATKYDEMEGSSCGTAIAAGLAALAWSVQPDKKGDEIRRILMRERVAVEGTKSERRDENEHWWQYLGWSVSKLHAGRLVAGAKSPLTDLSLAEVLCPEGRIVLAPQWQEIWEKSGQVVIDPREKVNRDPQNQVLRDAELMQITPVRPKAGSDTRITVTVKNMGETAKGATLRIEAENETVEEFVIDSVPAREARSYTTIKWKPKKAGKTPVKALLIMKEKDQRPENDVVQKDVEVQAGDFVGARIERFWLGDDVEEGQDSVDLHSLVRNTGNTESDFTVCFYVGKKDGGHQEYKKVLIKGLKPGEKKEEKIQFKQESWMFGPDPWVTVAVFKDDSIEDEKLLDSAHVNRIIFLPLDFVRPQDVDTFVAIISGSASLPPNPKTVISAIPAPIL